MKHRFALVKDALVANSIEFDVKFAQIAIESDAFDVVFLLRDMYPQSFAQSEPQMIDSIIMSFTKSNTCWLAKCHMFKTISLWVSYRRCEDFLYTLSSKVDRTDPKDNPLYYSPNPLLL
jgi:hypothetical protein